jgi:exodeoxyribonuclease V gamma subunit
MLHIHRAERADGLVEALTVLAADPLDDPMATEIVAVPTRGVERWLSQRLSLCLGAGPGRADGVCANIDFPFPGRLVRSAVAAATGVEPDTDPWLPERSVWPLLDVVDDCLAEPWLATLATHLGGPGPGADPARRTRRFATVRHVADLYARYGVHRPDMLSAWAAGHDTDGGGGMLPAEHAWQAELWRRLRQRIGATSPAERLEHACGRLAEEPALVSLPTRLSLFGLTRLPASYLQVLRALAAGRDVHLFLLHPSPVLWERVAEIARPASGVPRRADDTTAELPRNPLLASWGQDAREMQVVLSSARGPGCPRSDSGARVDHHWPVEAPAATLLERVQAAVRADRPPPGLPLPGQEDARPVLEPSDRSLVVHACHGRARQVEVVRDAILHLLAEDPALEARDVIVMCPDIESFAPLIHATFGAGDVGEDDDDGPPATDTRPPDLRVRLADRSLRQTNPVLGVVAELLDLASSRVPASAVLDLAGRDPVRRRFHFDDNELARMKDWVASTGVRWGLDAAHRTPFKLERLETNTWQAGVDRVLAGVAMTEEGHRLIGGVLPLDDVDSGDIDLAGRFAEFVDRLHHALEALGEQQPVSAWAAALVEAAGALTATSESNAWQGAELSRLLDGIVGESSSDGKPHGAVLSLTEIRALLADRLRGRPTRANFRTGHLTVCTLVPMRSVPHRVVCLLGLDDGIFPRKPALDGDDLILAGPRLGDRDARSEDRQLLLDALLAATDHLVVTYSGRDERTNGERPPAVAVGELLDVVDATVRTGAAGGAARQQVVVHHPLQPFDARNFSAGALVPGRAWSFDAVALEGARALTGDRPPAPPFLPAPLPPAPSAVIELDDLVRFVQHPVRGFLRQRLGISLTDDDAEIAEALPVELGPLEQWSLGQRLLEGRLAGAELEVCLAAEVARGALPPGALAQPVLDRVGRAVESLMGEAAALVGAAEAGSVEVNLRLADGRSVTGTVAGVCPTGSGSLLRTVIFSRVAANHRLAAWVRFLALTAAHPDQSFESATVGRARQGAPRGARATIARLRAFAGDAQARQELALGHLASLVDLSDRGMREPLPLACRASGAWAEAARARRSRQAAGAQAWESTWERAGEDKDLEHQLVLGGVRPFATLLEAAPGPGEGGAGWEAEETTRFGRYARRLWDPLLAVEEVVDR